MSAIRSVRYWEVFKYSIYGKRSWYIAHCPLYGRCPLFGVSAKRGSTVYSIHSKLVSVHRCTDGIAGPVPCNLQRTRILDQYREQGESLVHPMQPPEDTNPGPGQGTGRVAGPTSRGHESWTTTGNRESRWSNLQRTRILDHNREQGESLTLVQSQVMSHFEMSYVQKTSLIQTAKKVSSLEVCHHFCKSGTWGEERCPVQRGVLI